MTPNYPKYIASQKYPGRVADAKELYERLGYGHQHKLPRTAVSPQLIGGFRVGVLQQKPGSRYSHRVVALCPGCFKWVPAGRLQQHTPSCYAKHLQSPQGTPSCGPSKGCGPSKVSP
jgi:hypothetical protein